MVEQFKRRDFLRCVRPLESVAAGSFTCIEIAKAAAVDIPVVDKLSTVLIDGSQISSSARVRWGTSRSSRRHGSRTIVRPLHNQWGLSLYLQSQRGDEQRTIMLDFGYTPEALSTYRTDRR